MADSQMERMRLLLEEVDALERGICTEFEERKKGVKASNAQDHRIAAGLAGSQERCSQLLSLFEDKDGVLKEERNMMSGADAVSSFYARHSSLVEYHTKFSPENVTVKQTAQAAMAAGVVEFSGEEYSGRYLDLQTFHRRFVNLPRVLASDAPIPGYLAFLDKVGKLDGVPAKAKTSRAYATYVSDLLAYLESFHWRSQPLVNVDFSETEATFDKAWAEGRVAGWEHREGASEAGGSAAPSSANSAVDLDAADSIESLERAGPDALKCALAERGLKCGGTTRDRAERLFSVKGLSPEAYPKKLRAKAKRKAPEAQTGGGKSSAAQNSKDGRRDLALREAKVAHLLCEMENVLEATKRFITKKQTRTYEELEAEMAEDEDRGEVNEEELEEDEDEEIAIYNPLNLPLGWDGKPIPYWLYKLHGLGVEYKCEICGNFSYWGRRNFDRHFQEWRHAHGMRCLKIPNTKHFHDIVLIEDAINLYAKLKDQISTEEWNADEDEEFEDTEGNVMSRKVYQDLARQGLL